MKKLADEWLQHSLELMVVPRQHLRMIAETIEAEVLRINGLTAEAAEQREQEQAVASAGPAEIQAVIEAARQWWCERSPKNWDDAELAKAVIRLDGDWPGCPNCSHDCDEPCMPATMQEQLHAVDCHIAQLVHEGKLYPGDSYRPPEGWEPIMSRSKRATPPAGMPDEVKK